MNTYILLTMFVKLLSLSPDVGWAPLCPVQKACITEACSMTASGFTYIRKEKETYCKTDLV